MTIKEGVYLAGSIEGVSDEDAKGWRNTAILALDQREIPYYDPTRRVSYRDTPKDINAQKRIFKMDLQDIARSSVILADLRDSSPGKKWGTLMEVAHAHTKNKIIIIIQDEDQYLHPFIAFYATEIHYNLEDALDATMEYFT